MADITMCGNSEHCPKKDRCYRALATPSPLQAMSSFYTEGEECGYFWELKKPEDSKQLDKFWW